MASKVWTQSGTETLLASSDLLNPTLSSLDELFENITNQIANTGNTRAEWRFNNLATNIYATRFNQNGAGDASGSSQSAGVLGNTSGNAEDNFNWFYVNNISSREKMALYRTMDAGAATSAGAPQRIVGWMKAASTAALTSIQVTNLFGGGDFGIGSQMQVATASPEGVAVGQLGSWVEIGRTILTSTGNTVTVDNLANKRYLMWLWRGIPDGSVTIPLRANNDAAANYALRSSVNGGAESTAGNQSGRFVFIDTSSSVPSFGSGIIANLAGREKLSTHHSVNISAVGAATAPQRREEVGKWSNTVDPISRLDVVNIGAGDLDIGTELVILGWTPADATTTESNFWQPIGETILTGSADVITTAIAPKKYLWIQIFQNKSGNARGLMTFNSDSGSNYARRSAQNGAADILSTSATSINVSVNLAGNEFTNMFMINDALREKLMTGNTVGAPPSGAGTAPNRIELVGKWANSVSSIAQLEINNDQAGDYIAGSFIRVWGHD